MGTRKSSEGSIGRIKGNVERAAKKAEFSPLMEALTRLGYGVRGLIYITMGLLAVSVTLGIGGAPTDQQGESYCADLRYGHGPGGPEAGEYGPADEPERDGQGGNAGKGTSGTVEVEQCGEGL